MVTFTLLAIISAVLVIIAAVFLLVGGGAFITVFGDLIVCILIIMGLVKLIKRKRR